MDKLVVYKHRSQLEAKRREALDRHLSFLVAQTERYTNTLKDQLADDTPAADALSEVRVFCVAYWR